MTSPQPSCAPGRRARCARCTRPISHCLCAHIPAALPSRTRITVLQHPDEARHPLNTGRLAALGLRECRLLVGETFAPEIWQHPGSWLLFPGDSALEAQSITDPPRTVRHLIVPDGTWRKAHALLRLNPGLTGLPRIVLPAGQASRYRVRNTSQPGAVATVEAIVRTLNILEAPANFDPVLAPFEAMGDAQLAAMARALRGAGPQAAS